MQLAAQNVEVIRGRRAIGNLHIVVGTKLKKAFGPRRGMFGPLTFIAMREEKHETRHAQPFHFARGNELIDHNLRAVREIAELRFPKDQRLGLREAIAIFESEHGRLRQKRIVNLIFRLAVPDVV